MKRGVGKAMPTQHIVATNGITRPVGPTDLRDLMGIPRIPVAKTIQPEIVPPVPSTSAGHNIFRKENDKFEIHINLTNEVKGKRFKRKSLRKAKRKVKKRKHSFIAQKQEHQESDSQESY